MICIKCGGDITTTAKFCPDCGASQSPQQDAPVTSDSSKLFAQPNGTEGEPDGGRLPSPADAKDDRPIIAWASSSVPEDSEPKQSSGRLKLVLIVAALVLAIACLWGFSSYQHSQRKHEAEAHFERAQELKSRWDLIGAQREYEACLSECPEYWEQVAASRELGWIVPAIAAQGKPQPSAEEKAGAERQRQQEEIVNGESIDYVDFYAKAKGTGLPVGKRYSFHAILGHGQVVLCLQATTHDHIWCGVEAAFDNQAEYEGFLRGPDDQTGTVVALMGADGKINIHSFH